MTGSTPQDFSGLKWNNCVSSYVDGNSNYFGSGVLFRLDLLRLFLPTFSYLFIFWILCWLICLKKFSLRRFQDSWNRLFFLFFVLSWELSKIPESFILVIGGKRLRVGVNPLLSISVICSLLLKILSAIFQMEFLGIAN